MTDSPTLLLLFAWAVPMSKEEAARVFDSERGRVLLAPMEDKLLAEWSAAESFLASYSEPPDRRLLRAPGGEDALEIVLGERRLPCQAVITWHPAYHAMTVSFAATIDTPDHDSPAADVDLAIAVLQSLQGRVAKADGGLRGCYRGQVLPSLQAAVNAAFADLVEGCGVEEGLHRKGWCIELRAHDGRPPAAAVTHDPRPYYGLATGDEGWRFVPHDVARDALGPSWGTRTFVAAFTMATGIICLNAKGEEYVDHQHELAVRRFGAPEPYFGIDSEIAGLDHGMLFILERVLIRMALADQWLRRAAEDLQSGDPASRGKLLRGSLDDILEMLNSALPPEVDSLERRLVTSMGVERIIRQLDRHAEAMDESTRYAYESTVSARVTRLTVVTVVLTVVTIVLGVLQVIVSF